MGTRDIFFYFWYSVAYSRIIRALVDLVDAVCFLQYTRCPLCKGYKIQRVVFFYDLILLAARTTV
jgi:hypothetical protein